MFLSKFFLNSRLCAVILLAAATFALPYSLQDVDNARHTYLLQGSGAPMVISGAPEKATSYRFLSTGVNTSAIGDAKLMLKEGQAVSVRCGNQQCDVTAKRETVDHLLRRLKIRPTEEQMVVLDMTGDALAIVVTEQWTYTWEHAVPTSYTTERVENPELEKDVEQVVQEGKNGSYVETYADVYEQGRLISTSLVGRTEDTAVPEIVEYGTKEPEPEPEPEPVPTPAAAVEVSAPAATEASGGYLTFENGEQVHYSYVLPVTSTAYCINGTTATGYPTEYGNVAVDPGVIPYGTRMYIESADGGWVYGMAVARDCGGAIIGNMVDVWFPDTGTCLSWGRRACNVYILD